MTTHSSPRVRAIADDPGVHIGDHVLADGHGAQVVDLAHTAMGSIACRVKYDTSSELERREAWVTPWHLEPEA